ncbi:MAG: hypothetical protein AAFW97_00490 [Pseudomonadota bacterium]
MAVAVIEGMIEEVNEGRSPPLGNATIYKKVTWNPGSQAEFKRFVVDRSMNPYIEPGKSGRFYTCTALDQRGMFAYRGPDGEEHFFWPSGASLMWKILVGLGLLWSTLTLVTEQDVPILAMIILAFGIAMLITDRQNRKAGEELFNAGAGG